jgi:hypothetical protein
MSTPATPARERRYTPVVIHRHAEAANDFRRWLPASVMSVVVHCGLGGLLLLLNTSSTAAPPLETVAEVVVQTDAPDEPQRSDPLIATDIDKSATAPGQNINFDKHRIADHSFPEMVIPNEPIGVNGATDRPPTSLALPLGVGRVGAGAAADGVGIFTTNITGTPGGDLNGQPWDYRFPGRSGSTRQQLLINGGGTRESEAAVASGLEWLSRNQSADGSWRLDGNFQDRGTANDTAGTAFGLLPLLGAGKTHKPAKDNPYDKPIEKALAFLVRKQDRQTGNLGGGMYAHGLAAIALCEAYGLTQDPVLRKPAQLAVNYIVRAQHPAGGWRYATGQAGDTSVTGWQIMALKSAQMAGLDIPEVALRKAQRYLDSCCDKANEGYGYVGAGSTPAMSAVGLLSRQYLQAWGARNLRLIKGIDNNIKSTPPGMTKNMYYYYYATQVMHHFGGSTWKEWNEKMREALIKSQDRSSGPNKGSWSSAGDLHSAAGGRLMITSLSLLTLEVYYRHLPLYYRETGEKIPRK